jgi:hypothetical protein
VPNPPAAEPAYMDEVHDRDELRGIGPLARCYQPRQRATSTSPAKWILHRDPVDDPAVAFPTAAPLTGLRKMQLPPGPVVACEIFPHHGHANEQESRSHVIRRTGPK